MAIALRHRALPFLICAASASAGCRSESVSAPVEVMDSIPPVMVWLIGPDEPVNPGDSILVRFYAFDNVGIERLALRVTGAFELTASVELPEPQAQITAIVNVPVPEGIRLDVAATVTLIVSDEAGHTAEGGTSVQFLDSRSPVARLDLGGLHGDGTIRSGETLEIYVNAADNQQLAYIGYSGAGLRDSVTASSIGDSHVFRLTVPSSWVVQRPALTAWARDAAGHVAGNGEYTRVPVYDWVDHPVLTVPVLPDLLLQQVLWDAKRDAVYQLRLGPEGRGRIDGIDVLTGTPHASIPLPNSPSYFAFSVSRDSLVVGFWYELTLGVVDLLKPVRSTTVVPLQYDGEANRMPRAVQTSGQHLFVALGSDRDWGRLMDVNLGTGVQVIRTDIDGAAQVAPDPVLLPLPEGRLFVSSESGVYGSNERFLYSPETDRFTRTSKLGAASPRYFDTSPSGRFLIGSTVYNAALDSVAHVPMWDWSDAYAIALSPDGEAVYQSTQYGYQKVRVSDGLLLEQVKLPTKPRFLIALPDGSRVIAVGDSAVMIVGLR